MQIPSSADVRLLTQADVGDALQLSLLAGWNQTAEDWRLLLRLAPEGCFCVHSDGAVVATATLVEYGKVLAWVGMVLTHPEYRRQGLAKLLLARVLKTADESGVCTVKLDATDQGRPLYQSLGFVSKQAVERWERPAVSGGGNSKKFEDGLSDLRGMDVTAFGADRSELLSALETRGAVCSNNGGFVVTRSGSRTAYLGPCVAATQSAAREIIDAALDQNPEQAWSWDLLPRNQRAVALATELGFAPQRRLVRMARGEPVPAKDELVYAIAGFEFG